MPANSNMTDKNIPGKPCLLSLSQGNKFHLKQNPEAFCFHFFKTYLKGYLLAGMEYELFIIMSVLFDLPTVKALKLISV